MDEGITDELGWDRSFALSQTDDDEELLKELVDLMRQSSEADLQKIKKGLAAADRKAVREGAHSIKGAAVSLGFMTLHARAEDLENQSYGAKEDLLSELVSGIERLLQQMEHVE